MTISGIARELHVNRHTVAHHLDVLRLIGQVEMREHGMAKKYYCAGQVPFESFLDESSDLILLLDTEFRIIYANDTVLSFLGTTKELITGIRLDSLRLDLFADARILQGLKDATFRKVSRIEIWHETPIGIRFYLITIAHIQISAFRPAISILAEDVTDRKKCVRALKKSEERFRLIAENSLDVICRLDGDGRILYCSPAVRPILGYEPEFITGHSARDYVHPDDLWMVYHLGNLLKNGLDGSKLTCRYRHRDGCYVTLETTIRAIRDSEGIVTGQYTISRDISDRIRMEESLREGEERYRRLHESMAEAYICADLNGRLREFNRAYLEMLGYSGDELDGLTFWDLTPDRWHRMETCIIANQVLPNGSSDMFEKEYRRKDGSVFPVELRIFLIRDEAGKPLAIAAYIRDITDRKKMEVSLVRKNEALHRQSKALAILNEVIAAANRADTVPRLFREILDTSLRLLDYDAGGIYLIDPGSGIIRSVYSRNLAPEFLFGTQTFPKAAPRRYTPGNGHHGVTTDYNNETAKQRAMSFGYLSVASITLVSGDAVAGVMNVVSSSRPSVSPDEKKVLISIGRELGSALERISARENRNKPFFHCGTLFNALDEMIFVLDMNGYVLWINERVKKQFVCSDEDIVGRDVLGSHIPDHRDEILRTMTGPLPEKIKFFRIPLKIRNVSSIDIEMNVLRGIWDDQDALICICRFVPTHDRCHLCGAALHPA